MENIQVQFRYAYVVDRYGLKTLDVSDLAHPKMTEARRSALFVNPSFCMIEFWIRARNRISSGNAVAARMSRKIVWGLVIVGLVMMVYSGVRAEYASGNALRDHCV